ncbi:hypothetical protein ZYGR_0AZ02150 [Zygosaccharomyces rouxii]|uniref:Vacuolar segregation protein 7 n=1 Tax=Zygosaccharomyces rouxii TaxID=4956 RepID=A0A1Q3AKI8_ZYGRO|nr:hypothetical protein ZYGR_0AZ02150 [Zygosaccharomyces rouxii]
MSDEDHKLTVETETVEAPGESLLPSTIQPQSITTNENSNENGNLDYDNITTATTTTGINNYNNNNNNNNSINNINHNHNSNSINDSNNISSTSNNNVTSTGSNMNNSANNGSSNANTNASTNGSTTFRDISPAHQPSSATEANFNLIEHNPLSPHAIQSLKNKKSTLLINNDGKKENLPNCGNLSTSELSRRGRNDDLDAAQMATGGQPDQRVSQSSHSAKAATAPPAPPKQNPNVAGPPMIQRPSLPLMNSREILLENEKHTSSGSKPKENKEPERVPANVTNPHADNVASSTHNEEDVDSLHKPTKADFFAARLASAVGENDVSDSEETFIYESAANSTKNAVPGGLGGNSINESSYNKYPDPAQHGVASKMSVPVLNNNAKLLNRLKNTRHTSLSALPANPSVPFSTVAPTPSPIANTGTGITAHPSTEDLNSVKSSARQNQRGAVDLQSVKSFSSEPRSPDKRMSLVSLAKGNSAVAPVPSSRTNTGPQQPQQQFQQLQQPPQPPQPQPQPQYPQQLTQPQQVLSRKPSISNSTLRHVSASHMGFPRAKPEPPIFKRKLRTTASKIFDANGAPLRRYSGVPDDVNLEDYIEQHPSQDTKRLGHDLGGVDDQQSTIQEEAEAAAAAAAAAEYGGDVDEDDIHSMFFYNHHGNLESRPQISDYEEDGEDLENNNNHDNNNLTSATNHNQANGNTTYLNAPYGGSIPYANEFTPLKPKTHHARTTLGYSPHNFYTRKTSWAKFKSFIYFSCVTCMLLTVGFVLGFLLASNKELQDFNIVLIDNVLSSADELVFDVTVSALNPGFLSIDVQNVDLDIFAKSSHVQDGGGSSTSDDDDDDPPNQKETVLLGTAYMLETPLSFHGNMLLRKDYDVSVSSIKLLDPGAKQQQESDTSYSPLALLRVEPNQLEDDVAKWKSIIKHDYQLIVRGNMRYKVPYGGGKSVPVQSYTEVKASP